MFTLTLIFKQNLAAESEPNFNFTEFLITKYTYEFLISNFKRNYIHTQIRDTSCENLFLPFANNKDADLPAHRRSLISIFVIRCLDSIIPPFSVSEISSLLLVSVAAQAHLSLTWSQTPKTSFLMTRLIDVFPGHALPRIFIPY